MWMFVHLMLPQQSLRMSSFLFTLFSLFCSMTVCLPAHLFIHLPHLLIPSNVFFISVIVLFTSFLFFKVYSSLLNISCILSICVSINFLRSWIIFTVIIQNSFPDGLPISILLSCSLGVLSSSFVWNLFLCLLILSNFLCLWSSFLRLLLSSASFSQDSSDSGASGMSQLQVLIDVGKGIHVPLWYSTRCSPASFWQISQDLITATTLEQSNVQLVKWHLILFTSCQGGSSGFF